MLAMLLVIFAKRTVKEKKQFLVCLGYTRGVIMKKATRKDNDDEETGLLIAFAHAKHYYVNVRIAQKNIVLRTREAWVNLRKKNTT